MSSLLASSRTIEGLPYDRLKDLCENHENLATSTPHVQDIVCELLGKGQEKSSIWPRLLLKTTDEIIYEIAFEVLGNTRRVDRQCILSMVGRIVTATLDTHERMAITKKISPHSLLAAMENYVSHKEKLQMWQEGDQNRQKAIQKVFDFLDTSGSDSNDLDLANLNLTSLPPLFFLKKFGEVKNLYFDRNKLEKFPDLTMFRRAASVFLSNNEIPAIPFGVGAPKLVTDLFLCSNQISTFPRDLMPFDSLSILYLNENKIKSIPKKVWLPLSLRILLLSKNAISSLPENSEGFENLDTISFSGNQILFFPQNLKGFHNLRHLDLSKNGIRSCPENLKELPSLQELNLSENEISEMPRRIEGLDRENSSLRLSKNRIKELPLTAEERELLEDGLSEVGFLEKIPDHPFLSVYLYPQRV